MLILIGQRSFSNATIASVIVVLIGHTADAVFLHHNSARSK